jgi:hypothetical protein
MLVYILFAKTILKLENIYFVSSNSGTDIIPGNEHLNNATLNLILLGKFTLIEN